MKIISLVFLILALFSLCCKKTQDISSSRSEQVISPVMNSPENPDEVSIIRLIAHPEKYDGRWVRIRGFMVAEFESYGLCISQADLENHILKNCLLMGSSREIENHPEKYNRKYVTVLCKFDATLGGGMTSGGIKDLMFRVEPEVKQKGK